MQFSPLRDTAAKLPASDLVMVEGTIDAAVDGERLLIAPWHIHHSDDECFYVLEGTIGFGVDDTELVAVAGDAVLVPRGVAHTWWNASAEPARYLIAMPRRLDDLIVALHQQPRSPHELAELFSAHASSYIGWSR